MSCDCLLYDSNVLISEIWIASFMSVYCFLYEASGFMIRVVVVCNALCLCLVFFTLVVDFAVFHT